MFLTSLSYEKNDLRFLFNTANTKPDNWKMKDTVVWYLEYCANLYYFYVIRLVFKSLTNLVSGAFFAMAE